MKLNKLWASFHVRTHSIDDIDCHLITWRFWWWSSSIYGICRQAYNRCFTDIDILQMNGMSKQNRSSQFRKSALILHYILTTHSYHWCREQKHDKSLATESRRIYQWNGTLSFTGYDFESLLINHGWVGICVVYMDEKCDFSRTTTLWN